MLSSFRRLWQCTCHRRQRHWLLCWLSLIACVSCSPTPSRAETIELWHRPGGYTMVHIAEADRWLASGTHLVIRDWQVSAAAIQVLYFKRKGGAVCYAKSRFNADPALYFHLSQSRGNYRNDLVHYIGSRNAAKVGALGAASFKRFHPSAFGIRACIGNMRADRKIVPRPELMRW